MAEVHRRQRRQNLGRRARKASATDNGNGNNLNHYLRRPPRHEPRRAVPHCSFKVTVNDRQAPVITTNGPVTLWPPDHAYHTFNVTDLSASVSDSCDSGVNVDGVVISKVTSDEDKNGSSDGNGRVYAVTLKATDASGNTGTATALVTVPHSQNGAAAVGDGPQYTVLSNCP